MIRKANSTRYGLAAGVVTKNIDTMNTVSRSVRSGVPRRPVRRLQDGRLRQGHGHGCPRQVPAHQDGGHSTLQHALAVIWTDIRSRTEWAKHMGKDCLFIYDLYSWMLSGSLCSCTYYLWSIFFVVLISTRRNTSKCSVKMLQLDLNGDTVTLLPANKSF